MMRNHHGVVTDWAPKHRFFPRRFPSLGDRLAFDGNDIQREIHHWSTGNGGTDAISIDHLIEHQNLIFIDSSRNQNFDILKSPQI